MSDDDRIRSRLAGLAEQEFNAGSFEKLLERRESRLRDYLDVPGIDDPEEKCRIACRQILHILKERERAILRVSAIDAAKLEDLARHFAINRSIETSGLMGGTTDPGLPRRNLESYFWKIADLLRMSAGRVETREGVEWQIDRGEVRIRDSDTTRLLIHEINKDALFPKIVVIPNEYKRYNPFLAVLKTDAAIPTTVMRVLRAFSR